MRIPLWLKIGRTLWVGMWMPYYWMQYGPQNFLYFCDIANLLIGLALWLESRLLFSWQATSVLLFQTLYTIDLVGRLTAGKHLIGGTEYMFSPAIPLFVRLLGLFHVVTPVIYLAAYMLALPLLVYLPTHWVFAIWDRSRDRK